MSCYDERAWVRRDEHGQSDACHVRVVAGQILLPRGQEMDDHQVFRATGCDAREGPRI